MQYALYVISDVADLPTCGVHWHDGTVSQHQVAALSSEGL